MNKLFTLNVEDINSNEKYVSISLEEIHSAELEILDIEKQINNYSTLINSSFESYDRLEVLHTDHKVNYDTIDTRLLLAIEEQSNIICDNLGIIRSKSSTLNELLSTEGINIQKTIKAIKDTFIKFWKIIKKKIASIKKFILKLLKIKPDTKIGDLEYSLIVNECAIGIDLNPNIEVLSEGILGKLVMITSGDVSGKVLIVNNQLDITSSTPTINLLKSNIATDIVMHGNKNPYGINDIYTAIESNLKNIREYLKVAIYLSLRMDKTTLAVADVDQVIKETDFKDQGNLNFMVNRYLNDNKIVKIISCILPGATIKDTDVYYTYFVSDDIGGNKLKVGKVNYENLQSGITVNDIDIVVIENTEQYVNLEGLLGKLQIDLEHNSEFDIADSVDELSKLVSKCDADKYSVNMKSTLSYLTHITMFIGNHNKYQYSLAKLNIKNIMGSISIFRNYNNNK